MDRRAWRGHSPWGHKESDMTERWTLSLFTIQWNYSIATPAREPWYLREPGDYGSGSLLRGVMGPRVKPQSFWPPLPWRELSLPWPGLQTQGPKATCPSPLSGLCPCTQLLSHPSWEPGTKIITCSVCRSIPEGLYVRKYSLAFSMIKITHAHYN